MNIFIYILGIKLNKRRQKFKQILNISQRLRTNNQKVSNRVNAQHPKIQFFFFFYLGDASLPSCFITEHKTCLEM
jgi:hypothetical protein